MATQSLTSTYTNATDAAFRLWGSNIGVALAAFGWVNTADTGQINWTTVLAPTGTSQVMGYEVWRMDDVLQATSPVFLKLEYGSGTGITSPGIWVTLGQGSDGAGSLTGTMTTRATKMFAANAGSFASLFCGSSSRFMMAFGHGIGTTTMIVLCIERTRDSAGVETAEGFTFVFGLGSGTPIFQFVSTAAGLATLCAALNVGMPTAGSGASGTSVAVYPVFPTKGIYLNPLLSMLGYFIANIGAGSSPSIAYYGANHTYIPLDARISGANWVALAAGSVLMLFE